MSTPDSSDTTCVARHREPVVNGRSNAASLDRRLARSMVPSY